MPVDAFADFDFPLLTQSSSTSSTSRKKPTPINASLLLASYKYAQSSSHLYKTHSEPIDRVIGAHLRPGSGLQISSPPGCYVEKIVLGLIKNVVTGGGKGKGKEVAVLDCQNKLRRTDIARQLDGDEQLTNKVFYQSCHTLEDLQSSLKKIPDFLFENPEIALVVFSSLSFPLQLEPKYSKRLTALDQIRDLCVRICKEYNRVVVITSNMSTHFVNSDGSKGTFDQDGKGFMKPQIELSGKIISSLIISKTNRSTGQATFTVASDEGKRKIEFKYDGMNIKETLESS
ncbi:hypothetical protein M422DRAFT_25985 [Sphaerobolus stellatus SS14]|nr:hypothetical protein M422DRAFT_25985 [Sphaerobolus stellatus SS14]